MTDLSDETFGSLVERLRRGEELAAAELLRRYEPEIRREVRLRLTVPHLRALLDSADILQSVLGNFFVRAALGEFDFQDPPQLLALLSKMVKNRITDWARRLQAARRDKRREVPLDPFLERGMSRASPQASPSAIVAAREILGEFQDRLQDDERAIADLRAQGLRWPEIGDRLGESAEALRKRLERARDRIEGELGLRVKDGP